MSHCLQDWPQYAMKMRALVQEFGKAQIPLTLIVRLSDGSPCLSSPTLDTMMPPCCSAHSLGPGMRAWLCTYLRCTRDIAVASGTATRPETAIVLEELGVVWLSSLLILCELPMGYRLLQESLAPETQHLIPHPVERQAHWGGTTSCPQSLTCPPLSP